MSALAAEQGALNLSQGFPDFDAPPQLLAAVAKHLSSGRNQYAPMTGVVELREAIASKLSALYGLAVDADLELTVTSGATEALFCAIATVVQAGDEVIVFDPAYDSYQPAVNLQGGTTVHIPLAAPDYKVDWTRVADAITSKTRMIILNTPHNPTGSVWDAQDMAALTTLVRDTGIYLLGDEVYEHMVFDSQPHQSLCLYPELFARSFVVSSFGKTYHATGWKIGYCAAPSLLSAEFRKIHQYVTFTSITPVQLGLAEYMTAHPEHHLALPDFYQAKRDLFARLLESSRFSLLPSAGTYFQLLGYSAISTEPDIQLANRLTREHKIAAIPISVFYADKQDSNILRFCFAKDDATLTAAAEILCQL